MKIEIYTDGRLDDVFATKGPGGCAAILVDAQSGEEITRIYKGYRHTKSNRMQIKAIIWGILYAKNLKDVEEIKFFPKVSSISWCIFRHGRINTVLEQSTISSCDKKHSWIHDEPWDGLSALFCELKKKGIRISIVQLVDDDEWTSYGTRDQKNNYNRVIRFCREERDRTDDLIDSAFEAEDDYRIPKNTKKEQVERLKLRIKEILSIVVNRDADIYDLAARHALSGFALNTFGISCHLSDIPDRLSTRIMEADADTKRAFINLLEHLCYGEHGALEDTGIRVCSTCGELIVDGYHLGGDDTCSWPCTVKKYMEAARDRGEEANTHYSVAETNLQIKLSKTKRDREKPISMNWGLIEKGK